MTRVIKPDTDVIRPKTPKAEENQQKGSSQKPETHRKPPKKNSVQDDLLKHTDNEALRDLIKEVIRW
jgi:hypothetical protein